MNQKTKTFLFRAVVTSAGILLGVWITWQAYKAKRISHTTGYRQCITKEVRTERDACGCLHRYPLADVQK